MNDARTRVLAHADALEKIRDRCRYLGSENPNTREPARNAAETFARYDQLVKDLRDVCGVKECCMGLDPRECAEVPVQHCGRTA